MRLRCKDNGIGNMGENGKGAVAQRYDWRDAVIIAILFAVIFYYFRQILWTNEYIYGGLDIRRHFFFFKKVSYELMLAGELPLWIPYIYCGMPLLAASQVTPFYPVDLALSPKIQRAARQRGISEDTLINLWIQEKISKLESEQEV